MKYSISIYQAIVKVVGFWLFIIVVILLVCWISNEDLVGPDYKELCDNNPIIQCYPAFPKAVFKYGAICPEVDLNYVAVGPFMRSMDDLHFLYQVPAKYTTRLSKGKQAKGVFNTKSKSGVSQLYHFSLIYNRYLTYFSTKIYRFFSPSVCYL